MISDDYTPPSQDLGGFPLGVNNLVAGSEDVQIGTNALGQITSWNISAEYFASYPAFQGENPTDFYCDFGLSTTSGAGDMTSLSSDNDSGFCPNPGPGTNPAGAFSGASSPEPESSVLLGAGLLVGLGWITRRKFRA